MRRQQTCELPSVVIFNYCWWWVGRSLLFWREGRRVCSKSTNILFWYCGQDWKRSVECRRSSFQQHEHKLNSGSQTQTNSLQPLLQPVGDVCSYSKTDRWTKLCRTSTWSVQEDTSTASLLRPASGELDSCGREWNNNKGRILLAYLVWCEICLWAHEKRLRSTDKAEHISTLTL